MAAPTEDAPDTATQHAATEDTALAVVSIDGLCTLKSGVGSIAHWFFEAIDEVVAATPALQHERWSLHALSPRLDTISPDWSDDVLDVVSDACRRHRGDVRWFDVDDGSSLRAVWSLDRVERWRSMCRHAADAVRELAATRRRVVVLMHGTQFATIRSHLADCANVRTVYMTHTLGRVFRDANADRRTAYEDEGFALMRDAGDKIGHVGTYYRDVLLTEYDRAADDLVPFQNAVYERSRRFGDLGGDGDDLGPVPAGRRLVFSWGRCLPQKGFDVVVPGFGEFLRGRDDAADWHLVLLAPQEVAGADYVASLHEELGRLPEGSWTLVERFDPLLPFRILESRALEVCVFASRFEAGPLTLIEALTFGHEGVRIVWHDIPPMRHILRDQPTTFGVAPLRPAEMADALRRAADAEGGIAKGSVADFATSMAAGLDATIRSWDPAQV